MFVADCPDWQPGDSRLREALATPDRAEAAGFRGLPTVLIDGRGPFVGAPTVEQLLGVLS